MENKFTDSEIMKALEWLERIERDTDVSEWAESIRIILDDYNRQKAEIERLVGDVTTYKVRWAKAEASKETAKSEAIKEFWYKVKQTREFRTCPYVYILDGDNLLKEMEGEDGLN